MTIAIPPPYEPNSSPPSYDDLINKVSQMVGSDPTPQKYIDAAATLSDSEINVLMDGGDFSDPIKTKEDNEVFCSGAARGLASQDSVEHVRDASNAAVEAANDINRMFVSLQLKIAQIDRIHHSGFEPTLNRRQLEYRTVLRASRDLANEIAIEANRFDNRIIKIVTDENVSMERRKSTLRDFIKELDDTRDKSRDMEDQFTQLQIDFTSFIAEFVNWAKDREAQLEAELKQVLEELEALHEKLTSLNISILALGGGAFVLPVLAGFAVASGVLGPFLAIAGLIALGVSLAAIISMAALAVVKAKTENQIRQKERQRTSLQAQIEQISQTRQELLEIGDEKLLAFHGNINVLEGVWAGVSVDARRIQGYLEDGISDIKDDLPDWLQDSLNSAESAYQKMAEYLTNYARGISS